MKTGDKIKLFTEQEKETYRRLLSSLGFNSYVRGNYIIVGKARRKGFEERRAIGRKITAEMKKKNLSRDDLSEMLGVQYYTIWNWQLGKASPNKTNEEKLRKLGIEINADGFI